MNFREFAPRIKPGRRVPCVLKNPIYIVGSLRNLSAREKTTRNSWKIIFSRSEFSVIWLGKNKLHLFIFIEEQYMKIDAIMNANDKYNFCNTYFRGWKHDYCKQEPKRIVRKHKYTLRYRYLLEKKNAK